MTQTHIQNPHGGDPGAVAKSLGMTRVPEVRLDFSVNINPMGPPPCVRSVLSRGFDNISRYPPATAQPAAAALARAHGVTEAAVMVGNGSTEIFDWVVRAFAPARPAWIAPCYAGYAEVCAAAGVPGFTVQKSLPADEFALSLDDISKTDADMIFLASPNNPTGRALDPDAVLELAVRNPAKRIVLDESFCDFLPDAGQRTLIRDNLPVNLVVIKSLTKFFAVPGLRLGMACTNPKTGLRLAQARLPWSVNALAQSVAELLYDDNEYIEKSRRLVKSLREEFSRQLGPLTGFRVYPSEANFILVRLPPEWPASRLQAKLLEQGILIRSCRNFEGLGEGYCRLAVRPHEEIEAFMRALRHLAVPENHQPNVRL